MELFATAYGSEAGNVSLTFSNTSSDTPTNTSSMTHSKYRFALLLTNTPCNSSCPGVAALKWLPYGGLYLTGGLTPKNIDLIRDPNGPFMTALLDKGRVKSLLYSVPIYAVIAENVTERGSAYVAYKQVTLLQHPYKLPLLLPLALNPDP